MKLLVPLDDLPLDLPVEISGTLYRGDANRLFAWYGIGKNQRHIPVEVIVETENRTLSDKVEPGCADCGSDTCLCRSEAASEPTP